MKLAVIFHPFVSALIAVTTFSRITEAQLCPVTGPNSTSFGGFTRIVVDLDCKGITARKLPFPGNINWHVTEVDGLGESLVTMVPTALVSPYVSNGALMFTFGTADYTGITEAG
jgi:hypothetical protein